MPALIGLLLACVHLPARDDDIPETVSAANEPGHQLYVRLCQECHELKDPAEHPKAEWPALLDKFGVPKAHLSRDERAQILAFLLEVGG